MMENSVIDPKNSKDFSRTLLRIYNIDNQEGCSTGISLRCLEIPKIPLLKWHLIYGVFRVSQGYFFYFFLT